MSTALIIERALLSRESITKVAGCRAEGRTTGTQREQQHVSKEDTERPQRGSAGRAPAVVRTEPAPGALCADPARYLPGLALPQVLEVLPVNGLQHLEFVLLPQLVTLRRLRSELRRQLLPAAGPGHVSAGRSWRAPCCRPGTGARARPGTASAAAAGGGGAGAAGAAWGPVARPQERAEVERNHKDRRVQRPAPHGTP